MTCTILIGLVNKDCQPQEFFDLSVYGIVIISIISPVEEVFSCPHPFLVLCALWMCKVCIISVVIVLLSPESASNASGWSCNCWCRHQCCWKSIWRFSPTAIWHSKCCSGWHTVVVKYDRYICEYPFQHCSTCANDTSFCLCGIWPFQVKTAWHSFKMVHLLKHLLNLFPVTLVVMQSFHGHFVPSVIRYFAPNQKFVWLVVLSY